VSDPDPDQDVGAGEVAGGGEHGEAAAFGEHSGGEPDRGGAAADQQGLSRPGVESDGEGAVGGLQHLGDRAEGGGVEVAVEGDDLGGGNAGVLGVAAVEGAAHPTHHGHHLLPRRELLARAGGDDSGGLDAEHPRKGHALGEAEAGVQLGAVEPERRDADQYPARFGGGNGQLADLQSFRRSGRVEDDGAHGDRDGAGFCRGHDGSVARPSSRGAVQTQPVEEPKNWLSSYRLIGRAARTPSGACLRDMAPSSGLAVHASVLSVLCGRGLELVGEGLDLSGVGIVVVGQDLPSRRRFLRASGPNM
jgi:hypothetical protein